MLRGTAPVNIRDFRFDVAQQRDGQNQKATAEDSKKIVPGGVRVRGPDSRLFVYVCSMYIFGRSSC